MAVAHRIQVLIVVQILFSKKKHIANVIQIFFQSSIIHSNNI